MDNSATRLALVEERQLQDRARMDRLEKQSEKDIEKLTAVIKDTENRIMEFVKREFVNVEHSMNEAAKAAKEIKEEQHRLSEENKEQKSQAKINEATTATAIFFIAALVTMAEFIFRFVL